MTISLQSIDGTVITITRLKICVTSYHNFQLSKERLKRRKICIFRDDEYSLQKPVQ